jgi:predicted ATPase
LRTLGALVAVAQLAEGGDPVRLVGIEEPETALHPAASAALMDALHEAAVNTQVVVTTHSPDLLDRLDLDSDRLLVVQIRDGGTEIGRVDRASREAVAEHLATPGELLRMDYLEPDREDLERQRPALPAEVAERPA